MYGIFTSKTGSSKLGFYVGIHIPAPWIVWDRDTHPDQARVGLPVGCPWAVDQEQGTDLRVAHGGGHVESLDQADQGGPQGDP